jgi:V8-like Glu-specific endopeptidase
MDCLAVSGTEAKILKRMGSAFLISEEADFLTAAHVVTAMQQSDDPCPTPAITLAVGDWRPEAPAEDMVWLPFKIADCRVDSTVDVAECRPSGDVPARIRNLHKATPVQFEWSIQPDGTELAFTGFPLEARDPMTFRAHVAAYKTPWPDQATPQLILDHAGLPGFSGSPVFLANGRVVAIQVKDGRPDAPGTSIARPSSTFRMLLGERPQKK